MSEPNQPYPVKNPWRSLSGVLFVQAQNAFNDNFLKIILITLAGAVAKDGFIGENAQRVFSAFIPLAFIVFSPLAGYYSDRYSKRSVLFWSIVAQLVILGVTILGLKIQNLWVVIACLFLLSLQSAFFSPAKQGILKELVGSKKLTFANGFAQMATMLAILGGFYIGSNWFGNLTEAGKDVWSAALIPIFGLSLVALVPLLLNFVVNKTPAHLSTSFEPSIMWRHFAYLKDLFSGKAMTRTAMGVAYYWLVASFMGVILIDFAKLLHPDSPGAQSKESGVLFLLIGIGLMVGSLMVSAICRNGVKLSLVPVGGIGLAVGLALIGLSSPAGPGDAGKGFYAGFVVSGFFCGFFLVPLSSFLQDIAPNEKRGRIMGAGALLTSISGIGGIIISLIFTQLEVKLSHQMLFFVIPTLLFTWYVSALIKIQKELSASAN